MVKTRCHTPGSSSAEVPKRTQRPVSKLAALQDTFRRQRSMQSVSINVPVLMHVKLERFVATKYLQQGHLTVNIYLIKNAGLILRQFSIWIFQHALYLCLLLSLPMLIQQSQCVCYSVCVYSYLCMCSTLSLYTYTILLLLCTISSFRVRQHNRIKAFSVEN